MQRGEQLQFRHRPLPQIRPFPSRWHTMNGVRCRPTLRYRFIASFLALWS
jgi:hypothetical protein